MEKRSPTNELAAADPSSPWMVHLERAHALAHQAAWAIEDESEPSPHLEPAVRQIERGVAALYDAFDGRTDRPTAIGAAHGRLWSAAILVAQAGLTPAFASLREACGHLVVSEERFPRVPLALRAPVPLRAGSVLPPFHTVERASLAPSFRAPPVPDPAPELAEPELPEPTTFEELAAAAEAVRRCVAERAEALAKKAAPAAAKPAPAPEEVPPGFAFAPPKRQEDGEFIRRWARVCVDEVGMLGVQRAPLLGDDWRTCVELERRMVASIDALAALGPGAIAHVERLALDAPAPDPMRVFAVTMIGGCLEGRDALGGAERALHRFGAGDPLVSEAFAAAMKLAPSPFVAGVLRSLLGSPEPAGRAIAVEVLAYRGWLDSADLEMLAGEEDARLLALALPALAAAHHPDLGPALARALAHPDLRAREAALDAMALAAHRDAAAAARAAAAGELGDRALCRLAIVADEEDARWLLRRMQAAPTLAAIEAVGWAGLVEAVPALIHELESGEDEAKIAAGAALERLLGARLIESIELMPEELDDVPLRDPDPQPGPERRPLAEIVSDPRFLPPPGAKEKIELPSIDPAKWRAYWAEHGRSFDRRQRIRRGQAYSPSVSLYELDQLPLAPEERRRLQRELAARTGKLTHFDPHDFVVIQEQCLQAWGKLVGAAGAPPGAWSRPLSR